MADLGECPLANSYVLQGSPEKTYPLRVYVCTACWLAQTVDHVDLRKCFPADYGYFSSCSAGWVEHTRLFAKTMTRRLGLGSKSLVVEIAANDGCLLDHFSRDRIPCYGVEPTATPGMEARRRGLEIVEEFFGQELAQRLLVERGPVDLLVANNVLAHVPDINDFARGAAQLLKPGGVASFEFPHLMQLLQRGHFDTIYHEHFSYLSLHAARSVLKKAGLSITGVEEVPTHGGSLRVMASPTTSGQDIAESEMAFLRREQKAGLLDGAVYSRLQPMIDCAKGEVLKFLTRQKHAGKKVAAYGAAAKGTTLLNLAGVTPELISFVADRSAGKIGKLLPGCRIPIVDEREIEREKPDILLVLPWNLQEEIATQLEYAKSWGAELYVALPEVRRIA